jgi:hypothetical protein
MWMMVSFGQLLELGGKVVVALVNGNKVAKYNSAVASYVSNEPARLANLVPPQPFVLPQNQVGIGWLQAPPCAGGTAAVAYLPCNFDPFSGVGLTFNTAIALNGGYVRATTNLGPAQTGMGIDRAMGGAIVNAANASAPTYTANAERASGITGYDMDIPTGNITATVDLAVLGVPFLMTNGSNQMLAALNMGGNHINNANSVNATNVNATNSVNATNVNATNNVTARNNVKIINASGTNMSLAETPQATTYAHNGDTVMKPVCPPDRPNEHIFATQGSYQSGDAGDPVTGIQFGVSANLGDRWIISLIPFTMNHPTGLPPLSINSSTTALVSTTCGP